MFCCYWWDRMKMYFKFMFFQWHSLNCEQQLCNVVFKLYYVHLLSCSALQGVSAAIHQQAARISLYDGFLCPAIIRLSRPYCWLVAVTRYPARWYHADTFATPHTGSGPPLELSTNLRQFSLPTSTSKIKNLFLRHLNIVSRHKLGQLSENIIAKRRF